MKTRKNYFTVLWTLLFFCIAITNIVAQNEFKQNIKGVVYDEITKEPLWGANIVLLNMEKFTATSTNEKGEFTFTNVPVGRVSIQITFMGYYAKILSNINLGTAKELHLSIEMQESVVEEEEVEIVARQDKYKPLNRMATVSARSFTIEETQRFAGARNDVSRMASNFAGVNQGNDSRNDIIIRGNSPMGYSGEWRE